MYVTVDGESGGQNLPYLNAKPRQFVTARMRDSNKKSVRFMWGNRTLFFQVTFSIEL